MQEDFERCATAPPAEKGSVHPLGLNRTEQHEQSTEARVGSGLSVLFCNVLTQTQLHVLPGAETEPRGAPPPGGLWLQSVLGENTGPESSLAGFSSGSDNS